MLDAISKNLEDRKNFLDISDPSSVSRGQELDISDPSSVSIQRSISLDYTILALVYEVGELERVSSEANEEAAKGK